MPKVSVIMPAYNAEKYIGEAIESILDQSFRNFEFIIINDGSRDKTKEIILSYHDDRIVYLENKKNLGIVPTLNKGLDFASGEYVARMDSDDISTKDRFEKQVAYMDKHTNIGVLGTGINIFGEGILEKKRIFTVNTEQLKAELFFHSCLAHPTVMIRRSCLCSPKVRYDEKFAGREDFALWWELVKKYNISNIPEVLLSYRIHPNQLTQKKNIKDINNSRELLELRLKDLGVRLTEGQIESMLMYCRNDYKNFSDKEFINFIDGLSQILECNKKVKFFDHRALQRVFALAVITLLNNLHWNKNIKKYIVKYSVKKHIYSNGMRCKLIYCMFLKKIFKRDQL